MFLYDSRTKRDGDSCGNGSHGVITEAHRQAKGVSQALHRPQIAICGLRRVVTCAVKKNDIDGTVLSKHLHGSSHFGKS